jgi:hypothetical protein
MSQRFDGWRAAEKLLIDVGWAAVVLPRWGIDRVMTRAIVNRSVLPTQGLAPNGPPPAEQ